MLLNSQFLANLVTFTEEIFDEKLQRSAFALGFYLIFLNVTFRDVFTETATRSCFLIKLQAYSQQMQ